jgi:hypothetical protein
LDLPDTAPSGVDWSPFIRGFPHGESYVVARTFLDRKAPRAGMVLCHALFLPLKELATSSDIRPMLNVLAASPEVFPSNARLDAVEIATSDEAPPTAPDLHVAAETLTSRGEGPAVRVGVPGFEELISSLWFNLWPEFRSAFAFRLSFGPHDIVEVPKPTIICTPAGLISRWPNQRIIGAFGDSVLSSAAAILAGEPSAKLVLAFAREIDAQLRDLSDLSLLQRAYNLASTPSGSFEQNISFLRVTERLSPDPKAGSLLKGRILERVLEQLPFTTAADILRLRNFRGANLASMQRVWLALRDWAGANSFDPSEDAAMLSAIVDATSGEGAIAEWSSALLNGLADASRDERSGFGTAFWRWSKEDIKVASALYASLPVDQAVEANLVRVAPDQLSEDVADSLATLTLPRNSVVLHGAVVSAAHPAIEATRRQLSVDTDQANTQGLRQALRRAAPSEIVDCALELGDLRVLQIAAEEVAKNPHLLSAVSMEKREAQYLWGRSIDLNAGAWQGPSAPQHALEVVLDGALSGALGDRALIVGLGKSPLADLTGYARRAEVWSKIGDAAGAYLAATAVGWIRRSVEGPVPYAPDPELQKAVLSAAGLDPALRDLAQRDVSRLVNFVAALQQFDEEKLTSLLRAVGARGRDLSLFEATAVGQVLLDRRWDRALEVLVDLARTGRRDVQPALSICYSMIGLWTRWALGIGPLSRDEKWQVLAEVVSELYPSGPDQEQLWDRAGGKSADLTHGGSGSARWRIALAQIRKGKGPRVRDLLDEVQKDFPQNSQIRHLASDYEFR